MNTLNQQTKDLNKLYKLITKIANGQQQTKVIPPPLPVAKIVAEDTSIIQEPPTPKKRSVSEKQLENLKRGREARLMKLAQKN